MAMPGKRWLPAIVWAALLGAPHTHAAPSGGKPVHGLYDFTVRTIDGTEQSLAHYRGKTLLIVNTASKCGFTPQYESLERLYETYHDRGFEVLAFPANNFGAQEPGTNAQIQQFCSTKYATTFPLFAKISVRGSKMAPLYTWLTHESGFPGDIPWNFAKFLVGPDGRVVARFGPRIDPMDRDVTSRLEATLATTARP
jgi:glutathione peroxidase